MQTVISIALRAIVLAFGLAFALLFAFAFVLLGLLWSLRAFWARLCGRDVRPFGMRMKMPAGAFAGMRRAGSASRTPRADAVGRAGRHADISEVEVRELRSANGPGA